MGIYDREYYRRDGPGYLNALLPDGRACKWLIGLNIGVFILQLATNAEGGGAITSTFDLDTTRFLHGEVWRVLTYAFLHSPFSWQHIAFNMLFLWWFGSTLESIYGTREFLCFYLVAATLGGLTFVAEALLRGHAGSCLGASGAVTAVLVLYAFHFPSAVIYIFFLLPVPIWLFVGFQVAQDVFHLFGGPRGNVAVAVHVGGAAFAFLYFKLGWRVSHLTNFWRNWRLPQSRSSLRVYRPREEEPVGVSALAAADVDEHLEAKVDAVLEKVARSGKDSLTDVERQLLMRASAIYKKRRS